MRAKVLEAASELAAAKGLHNVTIPEIAARAGVAATSVYRRWGDVGALLLDVGAERLARKWPLPDEGSLAGDLRAWGKRIATGLRSAEEVNVFRILLATANVPPKTRRAAGAPRVEQVEALLQRARDRGEQVPPFEEVFDHLVAPLYMRALTGMPVNERVAEQLVSRLLKRT